MHNLVRLGGDGARLSRKPCRIRLGGRHFQGFCLIPLISGFLCIRLQSTDLRILFVRVHLASRYFLLGRKCPRL